MEIQVQLEKELVMRGDAPVKFDYKVVGSIESYDKNTGTACIKILPEYEQEIREQLTDDIKRPPLNFHV